MRIAGIICEYNPFHTGHALHIERTRALLGEDTAIVCVMSGNFVQRGEPAILRKHARAEMAVRCGADLVLELPVPWATASAERFALGGVSILNGTGIVRHIAFGSECGDVQKLMAAASALVSDEAHAIVRKTLETGVSYAAARQTAADRLLGEDACILRQPNNILGIEYLKAISRLNAEIEPVTIGRIATEHDGAAADGLAPASKLREFINSGERISQFLPSGAMEILEREIKNGLAPVTLSPFEQAILYRLRTMSEEEYSRLPDGGEGLWMRLMRYGRTEPTYRRVLECTKTKRYALSRIRRMVLSALLGITADISEQLPPYIRVLAFNGRGQKLLHEMKSTARLPIITKPAAAKDLPEKARKIFEIEAGAGDIYALMYPEVLCRAGGQEWTTGPVIV
ncbi:MAG: nucleotidyltransferase family protein [Oscillospiraceae bacterium]